MAKWYWCHITKLMYGGIFRTRKFLLCRVHEIISQKNKFACPKYITVPMKSFYNVIAAEVNCISGPNFLRPESYSSAANNVKIMLNCKRKSEISIAIICWANACILSAVLLARRRQMTLARCHFAHRANLIANRWFDVGPTPVAQQALHMPTLY